MIDNMKYEAIAHPNFSSLNMSKENMQKIVEAMNEWKKDHPFVPLQPAKEVYVQPEQRLYKNYHEVVAALNEARENAEGREERTAIVFGNIHEDMRHDVHGMLNLISLLPEAYSLAAPELKADDTFNCFALRESHRVYDLLTTEQQQNPTLIDLYNESLLTTIASINDHKPEGLPVVYQRNDEYGLYEFAIGVYSRNPNCPEDTRSLLNAHLNATKMELLYETDGVLNIGTNYNQHTIQVLSPEAVFRAQMYVEHPDLIQGIQEMERKAAREALPVLIDRVDAEYNQYRSFYDVQRIFKRREAFFEQEHLQAIDISALREKRLESECKKIKQDLTINSAFAGYYAQYVLDLMHTIPRNKLESLLDIKEFWDKAGESLARHRETPYLNDNDELVLRQVQAGRYGRIAKDAMESGAQRFTQEKEHNHENNEPIGPWDNR